MDSPTVSGPSSWRWVSRLLRNPGPCHILIPSRMIWKPSVRICGKLLKQSEMKSDLKHLAYLLHARNANEIEITKIIERPAQLGHVGEYVGSRIFDIVLEKSANQQGIDGYFNSGSLAEKSVNIKTYGKREGILDIQPEYLPDYYLVLTGPKSTATSSKGSTRPWVINEIFLFEAKPLIARLKKRGIKIGTATSVREIEWKDAQIYPESSNSPLKLTKAQKSNIRLFEATV